MTFLSMIVSSIFHRPTTAAIFQESEAFKTMRLMAAMQFMNAINVAIARILYPSKKNSLGARGTTAIGANYAQRTHTLSVRKAFTRLLADLVIEEKRTPNKKHFIVNNSLTHFIEK